MLHRLWIAILKHGFHLLYHQLAWTYDAVSWLVSFGGWRAWQKAAIPYIQGHHILEIAHGPGHMQAEMQRLGLMVKGIDLSPQMAKMAKKRLISQNLNVNLALAAAENLPFPASSFDSVIATFPTEFILAESTLGSVRHILRNEGRMVIVPQAEFTGNGIIYRFIEWLFVITGQRNISDGERDLRYFEELQDHFSAFGFYLERKQVDLPQSRVTILIANKIS